MTIKMKMHQMPGDVSKRTKAAMLEGKHPDKKRSKSFKKLIKMRERAVLKERTKKEVDES